MVGWGSWGYGTGLIGHEGRDVTWGWQRDEGKEAGLGLVKGVRADMVARGWWPVCTHRRSLFPEPTQEDCPWRRFLLPRDCLNTVTPAGAAPRAASGALNAD